jgi:hypothetical protein
MNMHQTTDSAEAPNEQQASANAAVALEFAAGHIPVFPCWEKDAVDGNGKPILNKQGFGVVARVWVGLITEHFVSSLDFPDAA